MLETLLQGWQKPFPDSKEMRSLDAGSGSEKANCLRVSLKSVYIGKVMPKSHSVNRFASNLVLLSYKLAAVEMGTVLSPMCLCESLVIIGIPCCFFSECAEQRIARFGQAPVQLDRFPHWLGAKRLRRASVEV